MQKSIRSQQSAAAALSRRGWLQTAAAAVLLPHGAQAAPTAAKASANKAPITIAQVVDTSLAQQDVSKDILIGARAAWHDINAQGGLGGVPIQHRVLEVDGSTASVQEALSKLVNDPSCLAVSATAGEPAAVALFQLMQKANLPLAHVAPWIQDSTLALDERTFPIFATRQEQIAYALTDLNRQGVREMAAVYATPRDFERYRTDIESLARKLKLELHTFEPQGDIAQMGKRLTPATPFVVLFVGGTPEMMAFLQGADALRQRYIIALADVNLHTLLQLGQARKTSVLGTQVVPVLSSSLPIVQRFKSVLGKLFDEPPSPLSLAGFIAAQYTFEVLRQAGGEPTRARVLAAFQNARVADVGGFKIRAAQAGGEPRFVAQSLLTADGRFVR